jgi:hypothetical protein
MYLHRTVSNWQGHWLNMSLCFSKILQRLELKFAQPGAKVYYTIDTKIPSESQAEPTEKSMLYKKPLILKKQFTTIKTKVFAKGFIPSETIQYSFVKEGKKGKKNNHYTPQSEISRQRRQYFI